MYNTPSSVKGKEVFSVDIENLRSAEVAGNKV
jgi:hypothetical protein